MQTTPKGHLTQPPLIKYLVVFVLFMGLVNYEDVVEIINRKAYLRVEHLTDLERRLKDLEENNVCYKLVAVRNGFFRCETCLNGMFYLYKGEIAKIGVTTNPEKRYSPEKLIQDNLAFIPIARGSLTEMRALELKLLYEYPLTPENLRRPDRFEIEEQIEQHGTAQVRYKLALPIKNTKYL